jgi:hypothetical protein
MNIKLLHTVIDQLHLVITHHPIQNPKKKKTQKRKKKEVKIKTKN